MSVAEGWCYSDAVASGSYGPNSRFFVHWRLISQSVESDTSVVDWWAGWEGTTGDPRWYLNAVQLKSGVVAGQQVAPGKWSDQSGRGEHILRSGRVTIQHDGAGRASVAASLTGWFYDAGDRSCSGQWDLPQIPRGSTVSMAAASVEIGKSQTVALNRASDRFTHTVEWEIAGKVVARHTGVATSQTWTIPVKGVAELIPTTVSAPCTVRVRTLNDGREIAVTTASFTVIVPGSWIPSYSAVLSRVDGPVPASWGLAVQRRSKALLTISSIKPGEGAKLTRWSVSGQDLSGSGAIENGSVSFQSSDSIRVDDKVTAEVRVTDSRGRFTTMKVEMAVVPWAPPTVTPQTAYRVDAAGNTVFNGGCVSVQASFAIASVNGKNQSKTKVEYQAAGTDTWTSIGSLVSGQRGVLGANALSPTRSYFVRLTVEDTLGGVAQHVWQLGTAQVDVHFRGDANGLGVGGAAEAAGVVDLWWPVHLRKGVRPVPLGDKEDLNDLIGYGTSMWYHQRANAQASVDRHYPVNLAGLLQVVAPEVPAKQPTFTYQTYHAFHGAGVWHRGWWNNSWSPWQRMLQDGGIAVKNGDWLEERLIGQQCRWTQVVKVDATLTNRLHGDFMWFADLKLPNKPSGATIDSVHVTLNAQQSGDIVFATAKSAAEWSFFILGFPVSAKIVGTVEVVAYGTKS
ncbi:MAG: DUF859 family phage minor structural protein [Propionibacteriaceae bacterium]|jgi:hypothetical protein|nr:DUF859 family phage minor structural protein [Propionibacteriaceae bacterium]